MMTVGILAIQGNVAEHQAVLDKLGVAHREVRLPRDLEECTKLILPGGESTVMARFLDRTGLRAAILERAKAGMPILGICAGAILLASDVTGRNAPVPLALMDITVARNAYGSQRESFRDSITVDGIGRLRCSFIRAPKITRIGKNCTVLASHHGAPVIVRQGPFIAVTCHPEQCGETGLHTWFLRF